MAIPTAEPTDQAATLLREWEARAQPLPVAYAARRPALLAHLTAFCGLTASQEVNVDLEDLRTALKSAASFGIAAAADSGPGRAARLSQIVLAALATQRSLWPGAAATTCLMSLRSCAEAELEMDELTEMTEAFRDGLGEQTAIVFGHGECLADEGDLRAWVLVGYGPQVAS